MVARGYGAAAAYALARSFFQRVFPVRVSEYVSAGSGRIWRLDALVLRWRIAWGGLEVAEARMMLVGWMIELL